MTRDVGETAADYFGQMVGRYDDLIRRAVPRYAEMYDRLLEYLPGAPAAILELGCGTGNLTLRLAERFPDARITAVDAAPEMVEITARRLAERFPGRRFACLQARFEELPDALGVFDLVTSCISLHHVADKGPVYRRLHAALRPGGTLRFADHIAGGSPWNDRRNWDRWLEFCREPGRCTEPEIESFLAHAEAHDHNAPLGEHFVLLAAAGFSGVDCVWRDGIWGILTADA